MAKPELLPIKRLEDLQTQLVGCYANGQFFITETLPMIGQRVAESNECGTVYVVRYLFGTGGKFERADIRSILCTEGGVGSLVEEEKRRLLAELQSCRFSDIQIDLFEIRIDDIRFGFVYDRETDSVNLEPGPIITFMEPWNGEYYT